MNNLTQEEKEIETAVLEGKYKAESKSKWGRYRSAAKDTLRKMARINIRIKAEDLEAIKRIAERKGIPYQTLIGSILHQFANGDMIALDEAEMVERFKEKISV